MDTARPKWIQVRLPVELHAQLVALGLKLADMEPKQQGNHEDNQAEGPPLWRVIETLLARDEEHRQRGRKNSKRQRHQGGPWDTEGRWTGDR